MLIFSWGELETLGREPRPSVIATISCFVGSGKLAATRHVSGLDPAGEPYDNDLAYVFEIADGRITAAREYLDTLRALDILGG